jgi:hypothetical protein
MREKIEKRERRERGEREERERVILSHVTPFNHVHK